MSAPRYRHAIVIGASSGIGREIARQLAASGCRVAALARRKDALDALANEFADRILAVEHDVTKFDEVPWLFQEVARDLGGLDLVVYVSGLMADVGPREFDFEKDRQMIEVNYLGCVAWLNQAATRFQETKSGCILGIASVAGDRGRWKQPVYNSSKGAMAIYMESLRNRLDRQGVRVVTVKPGPVDTPMTAHLNLRGKQSAAEVAQIALAKSGRSGEFYTKFTLRIVFAVLRLVPGWIFRKLSI
jgi:NAD(P)-dependent dehydrogenase (short-subunit alcohol dehydrogenase family)